MMPILHPLDTWARQVKSREDAELALLAFLLLSAATDVATSLRKGYVSEDLELSKVAHPKDADKWPCPHSAVEFLRGKGGQWVSEEICVRTGGKVRMHPHFLLKRALEVGRAPSRFDTKSCGRVIAMTPEERLLRKRQLKARVNLRRWEARNHGV